MIFAYTFANVAGEGWIRNDRPVDVRANKATVVGGKTNRLSKWGTAYELDTADTSNYVDLGDPGSELILGLDQVTVVMGYRKTDTTLRASSAFGLSIPGSNGANACGAHVPYSDGTVYWDFGGNDASHRLSVAGLSFGDDVWAFTTGPRGMEIWQNGNKQASNANTPSRSQYNGTSVRIGMHANIGADLAGYSFFYLFNSQIPPGLIQKISREPWYIYADSAPISRRFLHNAAGGAALSMPVAMHQYRRLRAA
jgi:hypothetical protein